MYCNLLQCSHFRSTCICAKIDGRIVGFVSGYLLPDRPQTLFIWQVVVDASARGQGLASRMLQVLFERPACRGIDRIETTITPSNTASQALFRRFAEKLGARVAILPGFDRNIHFHEEHASEELWRIGPITSQQRG